MILKDYELTIQNNSITSWKIIPKNTTCIPSSITTVNTSVYRLSVEDEQIVGLTLLAPPVMPTSYALLTNTAIPVEEPILCSQRFRNITGILGYVFQELEFKDITELNENVIADILTVAFNVVGSTYGNGRKSYSDTCRASITRDIDIASKSGLAMLISDYYLGTSFFKNKKLKEHLMKYRVSHKFQEDTKAIEQLFEMYPPRNL